MSEIDVYNNFCGPRFKSLEDNQRDMSEEIHEVREKLFNGMSDAIVRMSEDMADMKKERESWNRSKARFVRDLLLMLVGAGGIVSLLIEKVF